LLDLLRSGVATITTDVGTFSGYPGDVVLKVNWPAAGIDGLAGALRRLTADAAERQRLAHAALRYVRENHSWPRAASLYVDLIESSARRKRHGRSGAPGAGQRARHVTLTKGYL
jgi:glycosyltransferase involved in cell wall biosynthesis